MGSGWRMLRPPCLGCSRRRYSPSPLALPFSYPTPKLLSSVTPVAPPELTTLTSFLQVSENLREQIQKEGGKIEINILFFRVVLMRSAHGLP